MCLAGYLMFQGHWCPEVEVCHSDIDVEVSGLYVEELPELKLMFYKQSYLDLIKYVWFMHSFMDSTMYMNIGFGF
jgi:hypothetical protein